MKRGHYSNDKISISTIHGFKGLEAEFIIIAGLGPVIFLNSTIKKISKKKESSDPNY